MTKLINYLEKPIQELGSITADVIKAINMLEYREGLDAIKALMASCKYNWGKYKALNIFYKESCLAIASLDPNSKTFFELEFDELRYINDAQVLQEAVIESLINKELCQQTISIIKEIIYDTTSSLAIRKFTIHAINKLKDPNTILLYKDLLSIFLHSNNQFFTEEDDKILEIVMQQSCQLLKQDPEELWEQILNSCTESSIADTCLTVVCDHIIALESNLTEKHLEDLYNLKNPYLNEALAQKAKLSNEERNIIQDLDKLNYGSFSELIFHIDLNNKIKLPHSLNKSLQDFDSRIKNSRLTIISGNSADKELFVREYARQNKKIFIYLNSTKIIQTPNLLSEIKSKITELPASVLYLDNYQINTQTESKSQTIRRKQLEELLQKLATNRKIQIIASNHEDNIKDYLSTSIFNSCHSLNNCSNTEKRKLYIYYSSKLSPARNSEQSGFSELIESSGDISRLEFLEKILSHMAHGLLVNGQIKAFDSQSCDPSTSQISDS